jgi:anti-sigma-K factor RskA
MREARVWKGALIALSAAAVLALFSYMALWRAYFDRLPRSPDKVAGRVYADNFHGVAVYETHEERFRLHALENASEVLIALAIVAGVLDDRRVRRFRPRRR